MNIGEDKKVLAANGRPFEVLVVDDEQGDVELIRLALDQGRFACNVTVAINGREALDVLRNRPFRTGRSPDLVLLDLNMPQMNGHEVLREMKDDAQLSSIPVVVLTTSDTEKDVVSCYGLRAGGYVTKPVEIDTLVRVVHCIEAYWFETVRRPPRM
jgi:CheY-like chemotaxis protein